MEVGYTDFSKPCPLMCTRAGGILRNRTCMCVAQFPPRWPHGASSHALLCLP